MKSLAWTPQNITSAFLMAMLTVFLLAVGPGGYTDITHFKFVLLLILCGLYLLGMAASFLWVRKREGILAVPQFSAVHWLLLAFWLFQAISAWISPYFPETLIGFHRYEGLLTVSCYLLIFFGVSLYGRAERRILNVFAVAMLLFSLICFLQFLGRNPLWLYPRGLNYYDGNVAYRYEFLGTVGNVGLVAAVLSVAALVFAVAVVRQKGRLRLLYLLSFLAVVAVTFFSRVAAAYVAVFGGLLLLFPLAMLRGRRKRLLVFLVILLLLIGGIWFLYAVDMGSGTLHELHCLLHGDWNDRYGTGRLYIWRNVLPLVAERPWFGGGPDTLGERMTAEFQRYDDAKGVMYRATIDTAHNEYLNILVNEGALAFMAYMVALLWSFVAFVKQSGKNTAVALCGAGVLGYSIQAFFGLRMCMTSPFFWISWALLWAALRENNGESIKNALPD